MVTDANTKVLKTTPSDNMFFLSIEEKEQYGMIYYSYSWIRDGGVVVSCMAIY